MIQSEKDDEPIRNASLFDSYWPSVQLRQNSEKYKMMNIKMIGIDILYTLTKEAENLIFPQIIPSV